MPLLINTLSNVDAIFVSKYLHSFVEGRSSIRGSGGKNVIFSNCPYDQSKYSDPLIYISI